MKIQIFQRQATRKLSQRMQANRRFRKEVQMLRNALERSYPAGQLGQSDEAITLPAEIMRCLT